MRRRRLLTLSPLLLGTLLTASACGTDPAEAGPASDPPGSAGAAEATGAAVHEHHAAPATGELGGGSLYHLDRVWRDQEGEELRLRDLAGRVRIVAMVYTSCSSACPAILADMKRLEGALEPAELDDVGFVVVSIDPERDTPERLARFARSTGLDPARWTLLAGTPDQILEVAAVLGVQYRETGDGDFAHSNVITVLDPGGEVTHRRTGIGSDASATLDAIRTALPR